MERRRYTPIEASFLKRHARGRGYKELTELFNMQHFGEPVTPERIRAFIKYYGLKTGRDTRFKKGQESHTKGKKLWYKTKGFEKGHVALNVLPVGSERVIGRYLAVKVSMGKNPARKNWEFKHRMIWEKAYGKIPKRHIVIFADGNVRNFALGNLRLVSRRENAVLNRNRLRSASAALTDAGVLTADIKIAIAARERGLKKRGKR